MSYVVSIVRDSPIDREEVRALAKASSAFEMEEADGICILHWTNPDSDKRESLVLSSGSLDITTPSDAALTITKELARTLGAKVIGEEGEDLTDAQVSGNLGSSPGCGPFVGSILIIAALIAMYWLFN